MVCVNSLFFYFTYMDGNFLYNVFSNFSILHAIELLYRIHIAYITYLAHNVFTRYCFSLLAGV